MKLLLVASDPMEFRGILTVTAQPRKVDVAVDWARCGGINGHEVLLVANGVGRKRAAAAVDAALPNFPADRVISTGFCGAVDPQLVADCRAINPRFGQPKASREGGSQPSPQ